MGRGGRQDAHELVEGLQLENVAIKKTNKKELHCFPFCDSDLIISHQEETSRIGVCHLKGLPRLEANI